MFTLSVCPTVQTHNKQKLYETRRQLVGSGGVCEAADTLHTQATCEAVGLVFLHFESQ